MIDFYCGKLRVVIKFSFFAVLLLMLELLKSDWGLWCAGAGLLHETGHLLAYAAAGAIPKEISFECGGIRIVPSGKLLSPGREAMVLAAGSGVNLIAGGLLIVLGTQFAAGFHIVLGCFNLLPLRALDGGQLLGLLTEQLMTPGAADWTCRIVNLLTLVPLVWGGWLLFSQTGNFSLILVLVCLIFAAIPMRQKI